MARKRTDDERASDIAAEKQMVAIVAATLLLDAPSELAIAAVAEYEHYLSERKHRKIERPLIPPYAFDVSVYELDPERSYRELRFSVRELRQIIDALRWEETIFTRSRLRVPTLEALVLTLRKLANPVHFDDLVSEFHRSAGAMSDIVTTIILRIIPIAEKLLLRLDAARLGPRLEDYASSVASLNAPLDQCWGFSDVWSYSRRTTGQRLNHGGPHALRFQSITTPDGIIAYLDQQVSGLSAMLAAPPFERYVVYGDPGYVTDASIVSDYSGADLTTGERSFNAAMKCARVRPKWAFARMVALFGALDIENNVLRVKSSPVAAFYFFGAVFSNFRTIMDQGNEVSEQFGIMPPSLEEYLKCTGL